MPHQAALNPTVTVMAGLDPAIHPKAKIDAFTKH